MGKDGLPSGSAVLVVKRGPNAGSRFRLDQPVTSAGRHPDSGVFLDDVSVSRRHAEFRRENGEYVVVDTGSLNGTYVNRKPVESVRSSTADRCTCAVQLRLMRTALPVLRTFGSSGAARSFRRTYPGFRDTLPANLFDNAEQCR